MRIIAATNRDLEAAAFLSGAFRQDLYFSLERGASHLAAFAPERKSDIPLLVTSFLEKFSGIPRIDTNNCRGRDGGTDRL